MTDNESLQTDCTKIETAFKKLYNLDNIVILTRKDDQLGTFCNDPSEVVLAIIEVAHKLHGEGLQSISKLQREIKKLKEVISNVKDSLKCYCIDKKCDNCKIRYKLNKAL